MASYSYEGRTFRYPLFRVQESLYSPKMAALKESPLYDCDTVVHDIEKKVEAIEAALKEIEKQRPPGETITKQVVDAYIQFSHTEAKEKVSVSKGLIDDFTIWLEDFKKQKYNEEVRKGVEPRKVHPTTKDYTSTLNLLRDFEYDNYSKPIQVADVDDAFITDLIQYCYEPRVSDEEHKYLTEGDYKQDHPKAVGLPIHVPHPFLQGSAKRGEEAEVGAGREGHHSAGPRGVKATGKSRHQRVGLHQVPGLHAVPRIHGATLRRFRKD